MRPESETPLRAISSAARPQSGRSLAAFDNARALKKALKTQKTPVSKGVLATSIYMGPALKNKMKDSKGKGKGDGGRERVQKSSSSSATSLSSLLMPTHSKNQHHNQHKVHVTSDDSPLEREEEDKRFGPDPDSCSATEARDLFDEDEAPATSAAAGTPPVAVKTPPPTKSRKTVVNLAAPAPALDAAAAVAAGAAAVDVTHLPLAEQALLANAAASPTPWKRQNSVKNNHHHNNNNHHHRNKQVPTTTTTSAKNAIDPTVNKAADAGKSNDTATTVAEAGKVPGKRLYLEAMQRFRSLGYLDGEKLATTNAYWDARLAAYLSEVGSYCALRLILKTLDRVLERMHVAFTYEEKVVALARVAGNIGALQHKIAHPEFTAEIRSIVRFAHVRKIVTAMPGWRDDGLEGNLQVAIASTWTL
jgi:hypothetical protein